MKKVIVIVGPTGSGKTSLSLRVAKAIHADIINGDSVQIYRHLDIGSAKIKPSEMQGIKHHLLDIRDPFESYSVYEFQKDVRDLIDKIDIPMIVGGTGFYINAALSNYEFIEEKRDHLFQTEYERVSNEDIYQELIARDPHIKIDINNRRRLLRALEQAKQGIPRSNRHGKDDKLYKTRVIYLDLDRKLLEERLIKRLDQQLEQGFVEEVQKLYDDKITINAIGYREIVYYIEGLLTYDEMKKAIIRVSKQLAKKQKTYFLNQMQPHVFDALSDTLYEDVLNDIKAFLNET